MGLLVDGQWHDKWYDTDNNQGEFKREAAQLRNWVTPDGSAGETGNAGFKAEKGRYHLYVSLACPWAHRTLIFRHLKGLEDYISVSVVSPDMLEHGWSFDKTNHSSGDELFNKDYMHQIYTSHKSDYSGRVTVPVLWDKKTNRIVSNESAEIIRMFNSAFDTLTGNTLDFYPHELRSQIDEINDFVYKNINTEADWRLFTTLIRFDCVYVGHFKCNLRTIESYPAMSQYLRALYQIGAVKDTVDFYHIKRHYYFSHTMINPTQVVPKGPYIDYLTPHNRG